MNAQVNEIANSPKTLTDVEEQPLMATTGGRNDQVARRTWHGCRVTYNHANGIGLDKMWGRRLASTSDASRSPSTTTAWALARRHKPRRYAVAADQPAGRP